MIENYREIIVKISWYKIIRKLLKIIGKIIGLPTDFSFFKFFKGIQQCGKLSPRICVNYKKLDIFQAV